MNNARYQCDFRFQKEAGAINSYDILPLIGVHVHVCTIAVIVRLRIQVRFGWIW
jgi:hypothetical protein